MMLINMLGSVGVKAEPVVLSTVGTAGFPKTYPESEQTEHLHRRHPQRGKVALLGCLLSRGYLNDAVA